MIPLPRQPGRVTGDRLEAATGELAATVTVNCRFEGAGADLRPRLTGNGRVSRGRLASF